jgi:hypothetical protein
MERKHPRLEPGREMSRRLSNELAVCIHGARAMGMDDELGLFGGSDLVPCTVLPATKSAQFQEQTPDASAFEAVKVEQPIIDRCIFVNDRTPP